MVSGFNHIDAGIIDYAKVVPGQPIYLENDVHAELLEKNLSGNSKPLYVTITILFENGEKLKITSIMSVSFSSNTATYDVALNLLVPTLLTVFVDETEAYITFSNIGSN